MPSLPEELHQDIFLRLPVKSLLTCKCVCKSWFKLISDPSFVKSQLYLAVQKNVDNPGFIFQYCDNRKRYGLCFKSYRSLSSSSSEDLYDNCVELDYPFRLNKCSWWLLDSCNGLVCLWLNKGNDKGFLCLWNPATTEYKAIPDPPIKEKGDYITFGYDYNSDDYMVVRLSYCKCLSVVVYTLRSNSWKCIQTNLYKSGYGEGVFFNRTLNLLVTRVRDLSKHILVSLDTSKEEFVELQLPKLRNLENKDFFMKVVVLEGYLSVVVNMFKVGWEVWVMQNYGVEESWTKRYVISHGGRIEYTLRLMWSFKNGEILLLTSPFNLVLYDTVHGTARELKGLKQVYGIDNYVESLVSLNSGTYMKERAKIRMMDRIMGAGLTRTLRWNIIIPSCVLIIIAKKLLSRN